MREAPVCILGLDAADHRLVERWAAEGNLPTFARLLQQGVYGILNSSAAVFSGSAWISVATGCQPGKCGTYGRYQLVDGTYDVRRIKAEDNQIESFWSEFRGPLVIVDVPKAPLLPRTDGVQIVEWGAYDHYSTFASAPAHLANQITHEFGRHPFIERNFEVALHSRRDFDLIKNQLLEGVKIKQRLNSALMTRYKPRLFFSVFGETHAAGHAFWRFQDPTHPGHVPHSDLESALLEVYQAIDCAIASFLDELQKDTIFLLLSSQGFAIDSMAGEDFLAQILVRMGLSVPKRESINYAYVPYAPALALDMTRTRAFCLPTDLQGYVRINLSGREPQGVVAEDEYDSVCCELEEELLALRDCTYKTPIVEQVVRVRDSYHGKYTGALPDLSVIWNSDHVITGVESTRCGVVRRNPDLTAGGGNHRGTGFMIMYGREVAKGRVAGDVLDVAPTICSLLAQKNRPEWDGQRLLIPELKR
jgi:predicted AlkP superfamily phosphohydrolase/phosphomutase